MCGFKIVFRMQGVRPFNSSTHCDQSFLEYSSFMWVQPRNRAGKLPVSGFDAAHAHNISISTHLVSSSIYGS
jgi:hypothetical protein